jgi:adenylate cyclase, class 2
MKEIEILVKIKESKESVLKKLAQFADKGIIEVKDIYFYDPLRKELQEDNGEFPRQWFRLRRKGDKNYITYKVDNFKGDKWTYSDEHETEIKDIEIVRKIVEHLGLKKLIEIDNKKHVFLTKDYEIVLEDIANLGLFMEVEKLEAGEEDESLVKKSIKDFIDSLGIELEEELNIGKPELMLRKMRENMLK